MGSAIHRCLSTKLITPPSWLGTNLHYEVMMGSRAYGVNEEDSSDYDIYAFVIPPKNIVFPHLAGYIHGFDKNYPSFDGWQQHHINDEKSGKQYDFSAFNIVRYFDLLYDNNPNIIDSLFVPEFCIKHITTVGQLVRDNRHIFLSKEVWKKFRGYAAAQFHKLENKNPEGKRLDLVQKYGYDTKFAYHIIRLLDEAEQILSVGDVILTKNSEELKAIRRGEWSKERLDKEFEARKLSVEEVHRKSSLPEKPNRDKIRALLVKCLEIHYGDISDGVMQPDLAIRTLQAISAELDKVRRTLNV